MPAYKKEVGDVIKYAKDFGWELDGMTGSGHWRLKHRQGRKITIPATPSGGSWRKKAIGDIHRYTPKDTK